MTTNDQTPPVPEEPRYEDLEQPVAGEVVDTPPAKGPVPASKTLMIVDEKSGELIPRGALQAIPMPEIVLDFTKVGTLKLTAEEEAILAEPFKEEEFLIRPDGLIYIPWTLLNNRLNKAFGRFQHTMLPQGGPQAKDENDKILILHSWWLFVRGVPVTWATGECTYWKSNFSGSYGDAIEGAKSNAFVRCCKNLNIGDVLRMWDHEFGEYWKQKYAFKGPNEKGRIVWQKRTVPKKELKPETEQALADFKKALVPEFYATDQALIKRMTDNGLKFKPSESEALIARMKELAPKKQEEQKQ